MIATSETTVDSGDRRESNAIYVCNPSEPSENGSRKPSLTDGVQQKSKSPKFLMNCFSSCGPFKKIVHNSDTVTKHSKAQNHFRPKKDLRGVVSNLFSSSQNFANNAETSSQEPINGVVTLPPQSSSPKAIETIRTGQSAGLYPNSNELSLTKKVANDVERCERRLECLYNRLIWFRNTDTYPNEKMLCQVSVPETTANTPGLNDKSEAVNYVKRTALENRQVLGPSTDVEKQMVVISEKLHHLRCQVEAYSYLSWLGLIQQPQAAHMAAPGSKAVSPNPDLHSIRRPDSDARRTIHEYKRLCERPISDKVRAELRMPTFNNWPWSNAWLIRFVREMFVELQLVRHFNLRLSRLDLYLCDVYRRYNRVPFHNYKHAFMVTQMCYAIIWNANLVEILDMEELLILIMSAICHDLDHPGFNNTYQINAGTVLAIRYNDQSPLENHHCATAFDIMGRTEVNPFIHFEHSTFKRIREGIIRCILATDMSRHNEILEEFTSTVLEDLESSLKIDPETNKPCWSLNKTSRNIVMMILLKVCDISNEARPLHVAGPWINRLLEEFFRQSDYEKLVDLPLAPFMDRQKVTKSTSQCGFIRFVILPLFESLAKLLPSLKDVVVQPAYEQLAYYSEQQQNEQALLAESDKTDDDDDETLLASKDEEHDEDQTT